MGFLDNLFKQPQEEVRSAETGALLEFLENGNYVNVTEENALQVGGVKNAIELISGTVASLPINLYKEKNGKIDRIEEDKRLFLLNSEPNEFDGAFNYKKNLVRDMLFNGKAYAYIEKAGIDCKALHYIKANQVTKTDIINKDGFIIDKRYNYTINNVSRETNFFNMLEIEYGKGILKENTKILETLIYINDYDNYVFKNAILPSGVLETEGKLTQEGAKNLKAQMERLYSGAKSFFRPIILEQGLKWKTIQQNPNDLMLDKAKDNGIKDIERMFNLPYGILNNNANASVNEQNLVFLQRTITPILVALEEAFNKNLLLESEKKKGYYFRFDVNELMKMTLDKTIAFAGQGLEKGIFTINEARKVMDLDPFAESGDKLILSLGGVFMDENGEISVPNTGQGMEDKTEPSEDAEKGLEVEPMEEATKDTEEPVKDTEDAENDKEEEAKE